MDYSWNLKAMYLCGYDTPITLLVLSSVSQSSFAIVLKRKRELVALLLLSYRFIVTISVLWIFLTVPCVGLQCVIVVFPDHTHLLFYTLESPYNGVENTEIQK